MVKLQIKLEAGYAYGQNIKLHWKHITSKKNQNLVLEPSYAYVKDMTRSLLRQRTKTSNCIRSWLRLWTKHITKLEFNYALAKYYTRILSFNSMFSTKVVDEKERI